MQSLSRGMTVVLQPSGGTVLVNGRIAKDSEVRGGLAS